MTSAKFSKLGFIFAILIGTIAQAQIQTASCKICGPFITGAKKTCTNNQDVRFKVNGYEGTINAGPYELKVWSVSDEPSPRIGIYSSVYNFEALGMFDSISKTGTVLLKKGRLSGNDSLQDVDTYSNAIAEGFCELK
jgi:hypothetical protein